MLYAMWPVIGKQLPSMLVEPVIQYAHTQHGHIIEYLPGPGTSCLTKVFNLSNLSTIAGCLPPHDIMIVVQASIWFSEREKHFMWLILWVDKKMNNSSEEIVSLVYIQIFNGFFRENHYPRASEKPSFAYWSRM